MSIDPHIKSRNALAGIYGATASCMILLLLLIYMVLSPGSPNDDGTIRGAAVAIGFILPVWICLFLYFLAISFKKEGRFRFAIIIQTFWVSLVALLLSYVALAHEGWPTALPVFGITFSIFSIVIGVGSWCCSLVN